MKPRDRLSLALLLGLSLGSRLVGARQLLPGNLARPASRFVVYYGSADVPSLYDNDVAVLDSDVDSAIIRKFGAGSLLLGYLSLGEAHQGRRYADELKRQGLLLDRNPNWPDARFVDVRNARWASLVVNELVPAIVARGFHGLFIDTLDSSAFLEQRDPNAFAGMTEAAGGLGCRFVRGFSRRKSIKIHAYY